MAQFTVTSAELRSAAANLRENNNNFKSQVNNLESTEGTLAASWSGDARDTFHNEFMKDKAYMEQFAALIERYCQALEEVAGNYETAERTNVETAATRTNA